MKIKFPKKANSDIITALRKTMEGRSLGELVTLGEEDGNLIVKISKLGTSTLQFDRSETPHDAVFTLSSEKIAFAHKAFKDDVKAKLVQVIEKSGGTVLET
jgi:hypothetical protein